MLIVVGLKTRKNGAMIEKKVENHCITRRSQIEVVEDRVLWRLFGPKVEMYE
jgi:hypothetical protein